MQSGSSSETRDLSRCHVCATNQPTTNTAHYGAHNVQSSKLNIIVAYGDTYLRLGWSFRSFERSDDAGSYWVPESHEGTGAQPFGAVLLTANNAFRKPS